MRALQGCQPCLPQGRCRATRGPCGLQSLVLLMAVTQLGAGWEGTGEIVQLVVARRSAVKMLVLLIPSQGGFWLSSNTQGTLSVPQPGTMGIGSPCSRSRSGCGREGWSQPGASVGGLSLSFAYHKVAHICNIFFCPQPSKLSCLSGDWHLIK